MWPNTFEIVTALTLTVIGTIIFLYFIVLKRKGWLTDESSPEMSYLCPNPECRKVFEKPVSLTDLSTRPPRGYLACPYCGRDLEGISKVTLEESNVEHGLPLEEPQSYTENLAVRTETAELETPDLETPEVETPEETKTPEIETPEETKTPEMQEAPKFTFSADISKSSKPKSILKTKSIKRPSKSIKRPLKPRKTLKTKSIKRPSKSIKRPLKPRKTSKKHEKKKRPTNLQTCSHFFGYVRTLPKNTPIPDECLWCPRLVKCLQAARR